MASDKPIQTKEICKSPGCESTVTARGFCVACYYKKLRKGVITPNSPTDNWKHRLSNVDEIARTANCAECGPVKIFSRGKGNRCKSQWRCSVESNAKSRKYKQAYRQAKKDQLLDACEICDGTEKLCWDHNHTTGKFRGTLCAKCNAAVGLLMDNKDIVMKAYEYLNTHI